MEFQSRDDASLLANFISNSEADASALTTLDQIPQPYLLRMKVRCIDFEVFSIFGHKINLFFLYRITGILLSISHLAMKI
jgi:hypothetical protein